MWVRVSVEQSRPARPRPGRRTRRHRRCATARSAPAAAPASPRRGRPRRCRRRRVAQRSLMRATGRRAVRIGTPSLPHSVNEPGEITLRHSGGPGCCTGLGRSAGNVHLVELAVVGERRFAPGALDDLDRLLHALAAVVAAQPVADELVLVVDRALADADIDAALAEIVEQGELHGEPHRMVERHLHHGEADADAARSSWPAPRRTSASRCRRSRR